MQDSEALVEFLVHLCDTTTMKTVAAECLMMKIVDVDRNNRERKMSSSTSSSHSHVARKDSTASASSLFSSDSADGDIDVTFLDFLMNFVTQFEFPQKIVTFLLHLLPSTEYKVCSTITVIITEQMKIVHIWILRTQEEKGLERDEARLQSASHTS